MNWLCDFRRRFRGHLVFAAAVMIQWQSLREGREWWESSAIIQA
jgi:hypothetical protein